MRKIDLINLLHDADEETAVCISEEYPPFSEQESERIFRRIEERVEIQQDMQEEAFVIRKAPRIFEIRRTAAAAACLFMLCGTFAGLFAMKRRMPELPSQTEATEEVSNPESLSHAVGECFAAVNLTSSGTLWLTVEEAGLMQEKLYHVRIILESEQAVSYAESDPSLFQADNFMLAFAQNGGNWKTVQPCAASFSDTAAAYAFTIHSGETLELELCYALEEIPEECRLVTSYDVSYPYAQLNKEN